MLRSSTKGSLLSLEDMARDFEATYGQTLSKQAIDERFNPKAVFFLKTVLSRLINEQINVLPDEDKFGFSACRLRDSTRFALPDSYANKYKGHGGATKTKSMISIQYEFDLLTGNHLDVQLTSGCRNDQKDSNENVSTIKPNELLIRDLGYITSTYLSEVNQNNAFFLNRFPTQMNAYTLDDASKKIDFEKIYSKLKQYHLPYLEIDVLIGKKTQLPCRLIVSLCNEQAANKRLKRTTKNTKSTGHKVSNETKARAKLNIYITNAPKQKLAAKNIYHIYSLRWQIELIFKAWKSICNINKIKKVNIHRFECILLSGLIWVFANWKILQLANTWLSLKPYQQHKEVATISTWKFYRFIESNHIRVCNVFFQKQQLAPWLLCVLSICEKRLIRETKTKQLSHIQKIKMLASA